MSEVVFENEREATSTKLVDLTVIVVSWNTRELLRRCLQTLKAELQDLDAEVFLVDNASADGSAEMVAQEHSWVRLIANSSNLGFAAANNQALETARGRYVLLLNPDTEVVPGALSALFAFLGAHPNAGIVAPQLLNSDGTIQRSCRQFPTFTNMAYEILGLSRVFPNDARFKAYKMLDFNHDAEREVDQPEGACLLIRREVIEQVGKLDDGFFMLFEEVDWCFRIKQRGWQIWFTPSAQVIHHYGQSIKQVKAKMIISSHKGMFRFWRKHHRGSRWYLDAPVYAGLMSFAMLRILVHSLKGPQSTRPGSVTK